MMSTTSLYELMSDDWEHLSANGKLEFRGCDHIKVYVWRRPKRG